MERDGEVLTKAAEEYQLDLNGVKFWTPYWINWNEPPYFKGAPYTGKATPGQIRRSLIEKLADSEAKPKSGEDYRKFMHENGLGIDCSAIVYHMLARLLSQRYNLRLNDHVFVPKNQVIESSKRPIWQKARVRPETLAKLPDQISLTKIYELFGVNQRWNANVNRLSSEHTAAAVQRVSDARPGDMIKMSGIKYVHLSIVVEVTPNRITYVDSSREWGRYGGVRFVQIKVKDQNKGLEHQDWEDRRFFFPEKGDRLCRLRVLNDR